MTHSNEDETARPPGRPRDTSIDRRILQAARDVYARRGWSGFHFEGVARAAEVSKDAVYRRFDSPLELLVASLRETQDRTHRHEEGLSTDADLRTYLLAVAMDHFEMYTRVSGFDYLRLLVEAKQNPRQLTKLNHELSRVTIGRVRTTVRREMDAGRLPQLTSPTALLDAVVGGVAMHVMVTPSDLRVDMLADAPRYLASLIDMVLRGAGYLDPKPESAARSRTK